MGLRFRKSFKVAPGVRVNVGKKSVGLSVGGKGARYSINSSGRRTASAGIPGTGLSYTTTSTGKKTRTHAYQQRQVLQREEREIAKMQLLEKAKHEVAVYENQIDLLTAIHKEADDPIDWQMIIASEPPFKSGQKGANETKAILAYDSYKPSLLDRLFKSRQEKNRKHLQEAISLGAKEDAEEYKNWETMVQLGKGILNGEIEAYYQAIEKMNPLEDLSEFGSGFEFSTDTPSIMEVSFDIHSKSMVPEYEKKLTKTGKLSEKALPKTRFYALQQDYVCSCVLRIARDLFALLPIQAVYIHTFDDFLDTETGHESRGCILSVQITREVLNSLNFERIDCSDSMNNFPHKMKFRQTKGFAPIEPLKKMEKMDIQHS